MTNKTPARFINCILTYTNSHLEFVPSSVTLLDFALDHFPLVDLVRFRHCIQSAKSGNFRIYGIDECDNLVFNRIIGLMLIELTIN
jgi:hypothetical protein